MFTDKIVKILESERLIAVVTIDDADAAVPMSRALIAGGIRVMELTLRTPSAMESLRRIRQDVPEIVAGVGTILTKNQCAEAQEAGADFGVAPGLNPDVVAEASQSRFPFAPGIATASEIERAVMLECNVLKFFPSEHLGGIPYLRALNSPYAHLSLRYIPLGGVNPTNFLT